jgi:hypothetical protein
MSYNGVIYEVDLVIRIVGHSPISINTDPLNDKTEKKLIVLREEKENMMSIADAIKKLTNFIHQ